MRSYEGRTTPEQRKGHEKQADLGKESPERALVADISRANNVYAFRDVVDRVKALKPANNLMQEQIDALKQEINRQQLKLLDKALVAIQKASKENAYGFNHVPYLEYTHKLITINPNMNPEDQTQYSILWKEKLEPMAMRIFQKKVGGCPNISGLKDEKDAISAFPFSNAAERVVLFNALDDRAVELFGKLIEKGPASELKPIRGHIESFPFMREEKRLGLSSLVNERIAQLSK